MSERVTLEQAVQQIEAHCRVCEQFPADIPYAEIKANLYHAVLDLLARVSGEPPRTVGDTGDGGGSGEALFP